MEGEIVNFTKVCLSILASLCYCYAIGKTVPSGKTRLLCVLPIVCLFFYLPLNLSTVHLCGITAFFIAWLANFKLLLLAFGKTPLSAHQSLVSFIVVACLPIKIQENPSPKSQNKENPSFKNTKKSSPKKYAIKMVLLATLTGVHDYSQNFHPKIILIFYCLHIYFFLEIMLAMVAAMARILLGLELEPQFNEPYLSTSLQDFWGKRWNLMVTGILRPTVYNPTLSFCTRVIGRKWATFPAIWATFLVSAIIHELVFYYLGHLRPTWKVTWFFVLHGFCLTAEIVLKKALKGRWLLPRLMSRILTIGFVMVTGFWLFFPQFLECNVDGRAFEEYAVVGAFMKNTSRDLLGLEFDKILK